MRSGKSYPKLPEAAKLNRSHLQDLSKLIAADGFELTTLRFQICTSTLQEVCMHAAPTNVATISQQQGRKIKALHTQCAE